MDQRSTRVVDKTLIDDIIDRLALSNLLLNDYWNTLEELGTAEERTEVAFQMKRNGQIRRSLLMESEYESKEQVETGRS